jgi:uncharacterized protein (DUF427 family)
VSRPPLRSVWDFPRPPIVEKEPRPVEILFGGAVIARSTRALRVLETSHPPGIYVPFADVAGGALRPASGTTWCEYKGQAAYWNAVAGDAVSPRAAWGYPQPASGYEVLAGHVSFYPGRVDACFLGAERVRAQEGDFYGGWITDDVAGPFKGAPGTAWW